MQTVWGREVVGLKAQQGNPRSEGDVFMVMSYQVCLSNRTDLWADKFHHTIKKGVCVPTRRVIFKSNESLLNNLDNGQAKIH